MRHVRSRNVFSDILTGIEHSVGMEMSWVPRDERCFLTALAFVRKSQCVKAGGLRDSFWRDVKDREVYFYLKFYFLGVCDFKDCKLAEKGTSEYRYRIPEISTGNTTQPLMATKNDDFLLSAEASGKNKLAL